jgi:signal transduction histidine kinase/ligand-binding sensor domain-containing protein
LQTEDGLPQNTVAAIVQTRDGYLWLGTYSGLARFDGVRFTSFDGGNTPEMQSPHVTALFEAADGALWIGHETGELTCYQAGRFREVPVTAAWRGGKILAIAADVAGDLWLLNKHGELARVKDGFAITLPPGAIKHLVSIARNPKGGFWIQLDSEVSTVEGGQLKPVPLDGPATNRFVQGICASQDGGLWVMLENRIRKWKDSRWLKDSMPAPWGQNALHTVIETKDGRLIATTSDHGLYLAIPGQWALQFSRTNGFASDWVTSVCEDREGNVWAGTANSGLAVLRPVNVTTVSPPNRWQGRAVLSVAAGGDGAVWVGTEGAGLYRFHDGQWTTFGDQAGLLHRYIWSVTLDGQSRAWAGSWGSGVFVQNGNRFEQPPGLESLSMPVPALCALRSGGMCVGTGDGLLRYESGKAVWLGKKPELTSPDVRAIIEGPDGTVWFGMSGGGLGRYENGTLRQFRRSDGLASDFVQCLRTEANGTLWIGTFGGGLNRLKDGHFTSVTRKHGLPNDVICDIQDDGNGFFWISSHGGISRVSQADLNRCADGQSPSLACLTYGLSQGLPTLECSGGFQPAGCKTPDGRLWFPTSKGLVVVDPRNVSTNQWLPPVAIEQMRVDGHVVPSSGRVARLRIPPGRHRLEFDYTGLSFVAPERVRFKCRLEGLESEWMDAGGNRGANYNYVPPGDYTFRVIACNNDGVWNETGAAVAFTVLPFFWQTMWFRTLAGVALVMASGGLVWFDTRRRMRRKFERLERQHVIEQERARIANDIHDDLGSHLTRITMLSETARSELDNPAKARDGLTQIYDTTRELTRAMDEIVWAVNPKHDTVEGLVNYLEKFALDFLETAGIRCRLEMPMQFPDWSLTSEARHNLFLAFKEALHNVVRHAAAAEVCITLELEPSAFKLIIEDDGKGFDPEAQAAEDGTAARDRLATGNGLETMRRRLAQMGGRCEIHSTPGRGTQVVFAAPATL